MVEDAKRVDTKAGTAEPGIDKNPLFVSACVSMSF